MEKSSSSSASSVIRTFCKQYNLRNSCLHNKNTVRNIPFIGSTSCGRGLHYIVLTLVILSHLTSLSTCHSLPSTERDNLNPKADTTKPSPNEASDSASMSLANGQRRELPHQTDQTDQTNLDEHVRRSFGRRKAVKGANGAILQEWQSKTAHVLGLRVEEIDKGVEYENEGVTLILSEKAARVRLFGDGFTEHTILRFVTESMERGMDCDDVSSTRNFQIHLTEESSYAVHANIELPPLPNGEGVYYMCVRESNLDMPWIHQGPDKWLQIKTHEAFLPLWVIILFVVILLLLSGLFSGLNLGLMALDKTEMKIIANTGTPRERRYAKIIQPIRNKGNYLLCSLLLGNVMVNSTLTILLDDISSGLVAIIVSTLSIVVLGEIIPQAICSRHGLAVGAKTVYLTKLFMLITFPLSYPISVLLDKILGEDIGCVYNRDRLKELIKVTQGLNQLEKEEVNIISGALDLKQKIVKEIMTKLEAVFMLPVETILDFDTVSEIMTQGYSRIPIYEGSRRKIVSLLFTKDLALYDPDDKIPLKRFCQFYSNKIMFVEEKTTLDVLFNAFKQGNQGHMAFVRRITNENEDADPDYEVVGLVTMEDVIEEIIQAEINDETDVHTFKTERSRSRVGLPAFGYGWNALHNEPVEVSPNLCLAAYQFLSTEIKEFNVHIISKNIFHRLLNQNFFFQMRTKREGDFQKNEDPNLLIYQKGIASDYFVLILEGRVRCELGKENLVFESGPFTYFGTQAFKQIVDGTAPELSKTNEESVNTISSAISTLEASSFVPDYTVRAITDVTFLRISRSIYLAALQATALERTHLNDTRAQKEVVVNFEEQIDKMRTSCTSFSISGRGSSSSSFSGDSIITETDEVYTDEFNSSLNRVGSRNCSQQLNGTPMHKRKHGVGVGVNGVLSEIILTPNALLNNETQTAIISDHKENRANDGAGALDRKVPNNAIVLKEVNEMNSINRNMKKLSVHTKKCLDPANKLNEENEVENCKL